MVSLHNFNRDDCLFITTKLYPGKTIEDAEALIREWGKKTYENMYFEVFAIRYNQAPAGLLSLYERAQDTVSIGLEVITDYQRKGIGYEALTLALEYAKKRGYSKVTAQVRKSNNVSLRLHEKCGYAITDECITSRGNEAYVLERELLQN